jgi:hypothetical protein
MCRVSRIDLVQLCKKVTDLHSAMRTRNSDKDDEVMQRADEAGVSDKVAWNEPWL